MPDPQPPKPTPLKRFALQRPPLAPPGTVRIDAAPPPPNFSPWQLWGQGLLEAVVDPVRGALWGATGPEDTLAAKGAETVMAGLPLVAGVKSLMAGRGLYSRVDEALKLLPKKGAHPNKVASILKSNASAEELAYRGVPEFLASKGNATVTPADLAAHLAAHPAPVPVVKTLGGREMWSPELKNVLQGVQPSSQEGWVEASERLERIAQRWQGNGDPAQAHKYFTLSEEARSLAEGINPSTGSTGGMPKFSQYTLPGGEGYRETLVTLPAAGEEGFQKLIAQRDEVERAIQAAQQGDRFASPPPELREQYNRLQRQIDAMPHQQFQSGHFDEPNILVHTRANERVLPTGARGRFVEEVQSDWHQQGKKRGYKSDAEAQFNAIKAGLEQKYGHNIIDIRGGKVPWSHELDEDLRRMDDAFRIVQDEAHGRMVVPDAPFKEAWPDLGLKQQVLETAADPEAQWIGFTSGTTQSERYDLSKQFSEIHYSGTNLKAYDHEGNAVISQTGVTPSELPKYLGDEGAEKLLAQPKQGTLRSLTGIDLKTESKGMRKFYDEILPSRLEKIVKPFGGTVERGSLGRTKAEIDAEMDAIMAADPNAERLTAQYNALQAERNAAPDAPAWIAKLTPEMKARILKEGLPLLSLTAFLAQMGAQPTKETR